MIDYSVSFGLCDKLNPGFGYQIKVIRETDGVCVLFTATHPVSGKQLDYSECIDIANMYAPVKTNQPPLG